MAWSSSNRDARFNPGWERTRKQILERDRYRCQWIVTDWHTGQSIFAAIRPMRSIIRFARRTVSPMMIPRRICGPCARTIIRRKPRRSPLSSGA